ncbi:MAG TPA: hypothetical protein VMN99_01765, partial [Anaerolineales bacterium]|nr:hypothetical protein [Anaerolineales bacterium]
METPITTFAQTPAEPVHGKGFGIRAGAYVIDVVVNLIVALVVGFTVGFFIGIISSFFNTGINFAGEAPTALNLLLGIFSSTFYFAIFEWLYGS